jgi:hypothetical protein
MSVSATMEHRRRGQIGQPAACMIENNPVLLDSVGARSGGAIMAPRSLLSRGQSFDVVTASRLTRTGLPHSLRIVHCICGQLCGQLGFSGAQAARIQALQQIA